MNEKSISELEERKAEIAAEIDALDNIEDINARTEEVQAINAELEARAAAEAAKAEIREKLAEENIGTPIIEKTEERKMFDVESIEYRNAWLKQMMGREMSVEERDAMTATAAIPTQTLNLIINRLKKNPLLGKIDLLQIPGYVRIPIYSTNGDAAWNTTNEQADVLSYIDLTPYQLIKSVEIPATVNEMSIDAFEAYVTEGLANKIECALQAACIKGTGSGQPQGILTLVSAATGTYASTGLTEAKLLQEMGKLGAEYQDGAIWIMPAAKFYGEVMALNSSALTFAQLNDGFSIKLFGHDVVLDDATIQTNKFSVLYGQPKAYHLNLAGGIKVAKDESVGFKSATVNYRALTLADGKLDNAAAFVRYDMA